MIASDKQTTVVDHNDYDLTIYEAAQKLLDKEKVIAVEYPDYTREHLHEVYPDPVVLDWQDYLGMDVEEVMQEIQQYEHFGTYL
ncbi:MAG: hypothetical protein JST26_05740 [Bacteroidetes bacterium]|nr:hypothetical protein [Bacteroidota bacterium]